ncbi:MAG: hypothetical protein ACTSQI_21750 [Candidatus Helarchaeota archaeon]
MFREDYRRDLQYYPTADLINVRANKDSLQFCIFEINKKTGGYKILNEGTIKRGKVLSFRLTRPKLKKEGRMKVKLDYNITIRPSGEVLLTQDELHLLLGGMIVQGIIKASGAKQEWVDECKLYIRKEEEQK